MTQITNMSANVLTILFDIIEEHACGNRANVTIWSEELNELAGGLAHVPFRDEKALRECCEWCSENGLPALAVMITTDKQGEFFDQLAFKSAFRPSARPSRAEMKKAWVAEMGEIAALNAEAIARAREALKEAIEEANASKEPKSRRALANMRNQEVDAKSLDEWLDRYQHDVLDYKAPGEKLIRNSFLVSEEGYKDEAWARWRESLDIRSWNEGDIGSGKLANRVQVTLDDNAANWITKRFGGFDLADKLAGKPHGMERFERSLYGFYADNLSAKDFFDEMVDLLGRQYAVVSHLLFLKDKDAYVPVKPDAFEVGLRKLGIEFYLSGYCSWDNYKRFLGYLERIRAMLIEIEPDVTLLDAHSILWIIGSGYWFDGEGAQEIAAAKAEGQSIAQGA